MASQCSLVQRLRGNLPAPPLHGRRSMLPSPMALDAMACVGSSHEPTPLYTTSPEQLRTPTPLSTFPRAAACGSLVSSNWTPRVSDVSHGPSISRWMIKRQHGPSAKKSGTAFQPLDYWLAIFAGRWFQIFFILNNFTISPLFGEDSHFD